MKVKTGYWHGNDAVILCGNRRDGYAILVGGGYNEDEIKFAKWIAYGNLPSKDEMYDEEFMKMYNDFKEMIIYVDGDEWAEQQM